MVLAEQAEATTPLDDPAALTQLAYLHLRVAEVITAIEVGEKMGQAIRDNKSSVSSLIEIAAREAGLGDGLA